MSVHALPATVLGAAVPIPTPPPDVIRTCSLNVLPSPAFIVPNVMPLLALRSLGTYIIRFWPLVPNPKREFESSPFLVETLRGS